MIAYIERRGESDATTLVEYLEKCSPAARRLRSLVAKGETLRLIDYPQCHDACTSLHAQYERLEAIGSVIRNENPYWPNPKIQSVLDKIVALDPDFVGAEVKEQNVAFLKFVKKNYDVVHGDA